jgi:hypothetical protein
MNAANDPAAWQNFYIMIGTANAAITGLLLVALSLLISLARSMASCWALLTALETPVG